MSSGGCSAVDAARRRGDSGCVRAGAARAGAAAPGAFAAVGGAGGGGALGRPDPHPRPNYRKIAPRKTRLLIGRTTTKEILALFVKI